jgi:hypothetical protein
MHGSFPPSSNRKPLMRRALDKPVEDRPEIHGSLDGLGLLSTLIHELSQPLTVLLGEFELAASCPQEPAEFRELVERSLTEVNRAIACITLFRDLAPVPTVQQVASVSLNSLLKRLCDFLAPSAKVQGRRVEFSDSGPADVVAQESRLQILLLRLMQKLMDLGGPACLLSVALETQSDIVSLNLAVGRSRHSAAALSPATPDEDVEEVAEVNPKDPDWVLARWVAESSGGSFGVVVSAPSGWRVKMSFPKV